MSDFPENKSAIFFLKFFIFYVNKQLTRFHATIFEKMAPRCVVLASVAHNNIMRSLLYAHKVMALISSLYFFFVRMPHTKTASEMFSVYSFYHSIERHETCLFSVTKTTITIMVQINQGRKK